MHKHIQVLKPFSTYVVDKVGGRRLSLLCVLFLCRYLKRRTSSSKTLHRILEAYERFWVFDLLQFLCEAPIKNSFLHGILFDLHIFLYAYRVFPFMSTCIKHLFGFLPRHKHMNFKSKWIVHLYIHNKNYKLRVLFLPQGFFLSTNQVSAPHFSFSPWTLCT